MGRMGISSVTAYRGAKNFEAEGLHHELATMYGLHSRYSGFGINELAHLQFAKYTVPKKKGFGRYDEILRKMIWRPEITQFLIKAVKNEDDGLYENSSKTLTTSKPDPQTGSNSSNPKNGPLPTPSQSP